MNTINVENCKTLLIGRRGENEVTTVAFDFTEWASEFGSGVVDLYVKRFGDDSAYPVVLTIDGTIATWTVTATDTNVAGYGKAEYVYRVDGKIAKSAVFPFFVAEDIGQPASEPPDPYESWLEQLTALGAETEANAQAAEQSAEDAADSAQQAAESAASIEGDVEQAEEAARQAEAAKTGAESAAQTAETAKDGAVTAKQGAEAAATNAGNSAGAAAQSAQDAYNSKTAAAGSASDALTAKNAAELAQQKAEEEAESIAASAAQIEQNRQDIADQKSAIETIEDIVINTVALSEDTRSAIRSQGDAAYTNLWFPQTFVAGTEYTVKIDFDVADISSFYCGTTSGNTTSAGFVDGGNIPGAQWKQGAQVSGNSHTIKFVATAPASYFRVRLIYNSYNFENKIRVTVSTEVTIDEQLSQVAKNVQTLMHKPTDYAIAGITEAITHNVNGAFFNFAFLTDTHADQFDAIDAFVTVDILDHANIIDGIFHGGDFTGQTYGSLEKYTEIVTRIRSDQFVGKMVVAKGNHENYGPLANNSQFVSMFQRSSQLVVNPVDPSGGYGFVNYDRFKVRVVILNVWSGTSGTVENVSEAQLLWLRNTALSVSDGWTIVVIAHNIDDTADATVDTNVLLPLRQILGAFSNPGTQYGDFIFPANTPGLLAGVIVGHRHSDGYNNNSGFNKINVRRAGADNDDGFAVDIFTVDTSAQILYETRIGLGDSRAFRYGGSNEEIT